ncbi:hypothetical protein [Amnibacterium endophyticum]|uniref:DUF5666 domain-containing protein n=1 Tax=Amnibacterium endophyticum TaxID=2109337 RepID=A0ABW4LHA5_9MICO
MPRLARTLVVPAAAVVLAAGLTGCAQAASGNTTLPGAGSDQVEGAAAPVRYSGLTGTTRISLDPAFTSALDEADVLPLAVGDATLRGDVLALPVTGGSLTVNRSIGARVTVEGNLEHLGSGLVLRADGTTVRISDLALDDLRDGGVLTGDVEVDGRSVATGMRLFTLDGGTTSPIGADVSSSSVLDGSTVQVATPLAAVLATAFGADAVPAGTRLGTATIDVRGP